MRRLSTIRRVPAEVDMALRCVAVPLRPHPATDEMSVTLVEVYSDVVVVRWQRPLDHELRLDDRESIEMMRGDFGRPGLIGLFTEDGHDCGPPGGDIR